MAQVQQVHQEKLVEVAVLLITMLVLVAQVVVVHQIHQHRPARAAVQVVALCNQAVPAQAHLVKETPAVTEITMVQTGAEVAVAELEALEPMEHQPMVVLAGLAWRG